MEYKNMDNLIKQMVDDKVLQLSNALTAITNLGVDVTLFSRNRNSGRYFLCVSTKTHQELMEILDSVEEQADKVDKIPLRSNIDINAEERREEVMNDE